MSLLHAPNSLKRGPTPPHNMHGQMYPCQLCGCPPTVGFHVVGFLSGAVSHNLLPARCLAGTPQMLTPPPPRVSTPPPPGEQSHLLCAADRPAHASRSAHQAARREQPHDAPRGGGGQRRLRTADLLDDIAQEALRHLGVDRSRLCGVNTCATSVDPPQRLIRDELYTRAGGGGEATD
jgi:hypothetical protein